MKTNIEYEYSDAYNPDIYIKRIRNISGIDIIAKQKIQEFYNAKNNEEAIEIIEFLFHIMFVIPFNFSHETPLYRVRSTNEFLLHNNIESLTYRQKNQDGIDIGRVNYYGEPLLYAATTPVTALLETRLKRNDYFNYLHFGKKPEYTWMVSTIGDVSNYIQYGKFKFNVVGIEKIMNNLLNQLNKKEIEAIRVVDDFLYNLFKKEIKNKDDYLLTNSIAKLILSSTKLDGILYESVQHSVNPPTFNIAIKPLSFEDNYIIKDIQAGQILDDRYNKEFIIGKYANGKILNTKYNQITWSVNDKAKEFVQYKSEYS